MSRHPASYVYIFIILFCSPGQILQADNKACLMCHSAPGFKHMGANGSQQSLNVNQDSLYSSTHTSLSCVDCHADLKAQTTFPHKTKLAPVNCTSCHTTGKAPNSSHIEMFDKSIHGRKLQSGEPDAPSCATCHGTHDIRHPSDPKSRVNRVNIQQTCGKCHFDLKFAKRHGIKSVEKYHDSVHAKLVKKNGKLATAAVCTDCHGAHNIGSPDDADSMVNRKNVPATCGSCHKSEADDFRISIHGSAIAKGIDSAPVCTTCHGEHQIIKASSPDSPVSPQHIAATCSKCHEDAKMQREFNLPTNRLSSYVGSYHGAANKYGDKTVANCATCHMAHKVLPSDDPRSSTNKQNIPATCGKCHPGAGKNYAIGSVHLIPTMKNDAIVYWVRTFYYVLVGGMITSFILYILLDLRARWTGRLPWKKGDHR